MIARPKEIDTGTPNLWPLLPKDPPVLSARYQWRTQFNVCVSNHPNRQFKGEWQAKIGFCCVIADTEDEAEIALCAKMGIQHWRVVA